MSVRALHISKIDLIAFRGVEQTLGLEFGRRLTIIYGGNATGKSSIAQGIEFAISGQVRDYEDGLLPSAYLSNTRAGTAGRVSLTLDDGVVLTALTDSSRNDIERQFRDIGAVDWPERQPLPLTTTHVTTQGMLARVLGNANAVTRNDLSGLCAGAYLRFLVSRAQKLADHFRQASSGRNIQSELRDVRAAYDTAKLLRDSLLATNQTSETSSTAIDAKLRELNAKLNLPEPSSIDTILSHLGGRVENTERQLRVVQGLLGRTRELGQNEAEAHQLQTKLKESQTTHASLLEKKGAGSASLVKTTDRLKETTSRRARLLDEIAAYERYQQSVSGIAALEERLREIGSSGQRIKEDLRGLQQQLDSARSDLLARSTKLAQLRQSRQVAEVQRIVIQQTLVDVSALPSERDQELEATLDSLQRELVDLTRSAEAASKDLSETRQAEATSAARMAEVSTSAERVLAAGSELRLHVTDSRCPLCGHDHGSIEALEQAMQHIFALSLEGTESLRRQYEAAIARRQASENHQVELDRLITDIRAKSSAATAQIEKKVQQRRTAISILEENLRRAGVSVPLESAALRRIQAEVEAKIAGLDQEIRDESSAELDEEKSRSQFERALAAKSSESEQRDRLAAELNDQITKVRASLGVGATVEDIAPKRLELIEVEPLIKALEREQGQAAASLSELDRAIAEKMLEIAGIERRLQAVQGFLDSLDAELKTVGASRDVRTVLDMEQRIRQELDSLISFKQKAVEIRQSLHSLEQNRTLSQAQDQLAAAEQSLRAIQDRQRQLQERGVQFKNLHQSLETLQNDTAEIVLQNIRRPVSIVFQAMTAGCPWDIEFRLEDGRVNAVLTDGSAHDLTATSVLNSAYVNVAAIALRLSLASQQRWTRLRTVVLDDPILEMDHLTQSALIDGLEAVLTSAFQPWKDLQFVLTTWSEDFAVMAAHKLAHLNDINDQDDPVMRVALPENFVIHRLSSELDGTIASERHIPRWRSTTIAA